MAKPLVERNPVTQFLLFQPQSAPQGFAQSSTGSGFLGSNATASGDFAPDGSPILTADLDGSTGEAPSFANFLNAETAEASDVAVTQSDLTAFVATGAVTLSDGDELNTAINPLPLDGGSLFAGASELEADESLALNSTSLTNSILLNGEQTQADDISSFNSAQTDTQETDSALDGAALGAGPLLQGVTQEIAIEGFVRAAFGPESLTAQPSGIDDIDGDATLGDADGGQLPTGANAANTGGDNLGNLSVSDTVDFSDLILPTRPLATSTGTLSAEPSQEIVEEGAIVNNALQNGLVQNEFALTRPILDAEISSAGPSSSASANTSQVAPELLSPSRPLILNDGLTNGNLPTDESVGLNSAQISPQVRSDAGVPAALGGQNGIQSAFNPAPAAEQNLGQLNSELAESQLQRLDQNIPRQASVAPSAPAQAEASIISGTQAATANANAILSPLRQVNPNVVDADNIANTANVTQANQPVVGASDEALNSTPTASPDTRASNNNLSNISQITQLLGQSSGNDAQLASLQTNNQPTIQLSTNGPAASVGQQPTAQLTPSFFTNETLPTLTAQLSRGVVGGRDSFNVQLNPSELGRVDVRFFTNDDGSVNARVLVERAETLELFNRDLRALERSFLQSGIKLSQEGIDLSLKDNGTNQGGNSAAANGDATGNEDQSGSDNTQNLEDEGNRTLNGRLLVEDIEANVPGDVIQNIYARFTPGQLNIEV